MLNYFVGYSPIIDVFMNADGRVVNDLDDATKYSVAADVKQLSVPLKAAVYKILPEGKLVKVDSEGNTDVPFIAAYAITRIGPKYGLIQYANVGEDGYVTFVYDPREAMKFTASDDAFAVFIASDLERHGFSVSLV